MKFNARFWLLITVSVLLFFSVKQSLFSSGKKAKRLPNYVVELKEKFDSGYFSKFLDQWHDLYQKSRAKLGFNDDLTRRKAIADVKKNQQFSNSDQKKPELFIMTHRNALLSLCQKHSKEPLAQELKKSLTFSLSSSQQKSVAYVESIRDKFQGDGKSPIENTLIKIDTEYWLKKIALISALARDEYNKVDFREKMIVLEMEKMKAMKTACEETSYCDAVISSHIQTVESITPELQAKHWSNQAVLKLKKQEGDKTPFESELLLLMENPNAYLQEG